MLEKQIKLLIVDDHSIIRDGLVKLLQDEEFIDIVLVCNNGKSVLDYLEENEVDIIVSDISMPDMNGLEMTELIVNKFSFHNILFLTMHEDEDNILAAVDKGVLGYITKEIKRAELLQAIKKVANGEKYYSANILETMVKASVIRSRKPTIKNHLTPKLTDREMTVLTYIANGLNNNEIGLELKISKRTVDTHRTNIMKKLNAKNTAMIVSIAIELNLV